jgi:hypothetical protein
MNHIREKLPDMKARLNTLMGQTQQELNSFGDLTFLGEQHRVSLYSFLPLLFCELMPTETRLLFFLDRARSSSNS